MRILLMLNTTNYLVIVILPRLELVLLGNTIRYKLDIEHLYKVLLYSTCVVVVVIVVVIIE